MSKNSRVIWSEGLFIKPHHFQQMQNNVEYLIESRSKSLITNRYGILDFKINEEHLKFGKITLDYVSGIMPDGTYFDFPVEDLLPHSLEVSSTQAGNEIVYLVVSEKNNSQYEICQSTEGAGRYIKESSLVRDTHSDTGKVDEIDIARVKLDLMLGNEDKSSYSAIAIARIQHKTDSGAVQLYPDYIPCHLNSKRIQIISSYLTELEGLVRTRAENIAKRVGSPSQSGVADVSDFMMLQLLNGMQGELKGVLNTNHLHPEVLHHFMMRYSSELATFVAENRLPPTFLSFDHAYPDQSIKEGMYLLREALSYEFDLRAIPIQIKPREYGISIAPIGDTSLLNDAEFILALKAQMSHEDLKRYFLQQAKVASIENIRDITSVQLPAIPLIPLPVTPRQLPYHADYLYFKLDKSHSSWQMLKGSSGFAFHVPPENFPNLNMQFWAIRE